MSVSHYEYLADPHRDCREELLLRLLQDLGEVPSPDTSILTVESTSEAAESPAMGLESSPGSILVYSSYEKTQLNKLAALFPLHAVAIGRVVDRLVDLEPVVRTNLSHALFRGKSSLKVRRKRGC